MYLEGFYIEGDRGNNSFSLDKRKNKSLYVPKIIDLDIKDLEKITLQDYREKVAFEDFDFEGKLQACYGLKNFYRINREGKEIILVDNHNHVFYFWYEARKKGIIKDNSLLIHIDEHSDMKDDGNYISKTESQDLKKVFEFTNFVLNVGNYIMPAMKEGIIGKVIQIRNEANLREYKKEMDNNRDIILNLDLDFFCSELDYIDYGLKKQVILDCVNRAKIITVSSSPFFIEQAKAIKVFQDIFSL